MPQKAFPKAYGPDGAKNTIAGRYGKVHVITSKADNGNNTTPIVGSFRAAVSGDIPAIVVFKVGGIFDLTTTASTSDILIGSNKTILGGICPGNAPTFRHRAIRFGANKSNIILRYIRSRLGDQTGNRQIDAFTGDGNSNVIIDHCSFSWSVDEILSMVNTCSDYSIQYSIISEALHNSFHLDGRHGFAGIIGQLNVCLYRNLMAHYYERGPLISTSNNIFDMRNCFMYNWRQKPATGGTTSNANLLWNYFKPGPCTTQTETGQDPWDVRWSTNFLHPTESNLDPLTLGKFYLEGNVLEGTSLGTTVEDQWIGVKMRNSDFQDNHLDKTKNKDIDGNIVIHTLPGDWYEGSEVTAVQARDICLAEAGASITRDVHDLRIVENATNGTTSATGSVTGFFGLIDSQNDVGGWGAEVTTPDVLTGDEPHYLPSWFITKYNLDMDIEKDYISAGDPSTHPWKFIFFASNVATNYPITAPVGWEDIVHYNVYEVLLFEENGEIALLTGEIIEPTTYTLTLTTTAGGTATRNPESGDIEQSTTVILTATPSSGFNFSRWQNAITSQVLSTSTTYNHVMTSDISIVAVFVEEGVIPPPEGIRVFRIEDEPIV